MTDTVRVTDTEGVKRLLLGLPVAAALAVGLYAGPTMPWSSTPGEGSVEVGFSRDMQVHHAQAVSMSALAFDRSRDPEVRAIALDVVTTQQSQIGTMAGWLDEWGMPTRGPAQAMAWMGSSPHGGHTMGADGQMPGMATQDQLDALAAARGPDFDTLWVDLLREHHAGGLSMLRAALDGTDRDSVELLAGSMLSSQEAEIEVLDELGARLAR